MLIYLMRHAIAVERGNEAYLDDDRPLTDKGKRKMSEASGGMVSLIRDIDLILTSPLKRAPGDITTRSACPEPVTLTAKTLPHTAQRARMPDAGTFAGSTR